MWSNDDDESDRSGDDYGNDRESLNMLNSLGRYDEEYIDRDWGDSNYMNMNTIRSTIRFSSPVRIRRPMKAEFNNDASPSQISGTHGNQLLAHFVFTPSTIQQERHRHHGSQDEVTPFLKLIQSTGVKLSMTLRKLVPNTLRSIESWGRYMNLDVTPQSNRIRDEIAAMKPGSLLSFYLCKHNVALILARNEENVSLGFFQVKPDPTFINENHKIRTSYPENSFFVPFSNLIKSSAFAEKIFNLSKIVDSVPSDLIVEWLTLTLLGDDDPVQSRDEEFLAIEKSIRDEAYCTETARSGYWTVLKVSLHLSFVRERGLQEGTLLYKLFIIKMFITIMEITVEGNRSLEILDELRKKLCSKIGKINRITVTLTKDLNQIKNSILTIADTVLKMVNNKLQTAFEVPKKFVGEKLSDHWLTELIEYVKGRRNPIGSGDVSRSSFRNSLENNCLTIDKMSDIDTYNFEKSIRLKENLDPVRIRDEILKYSCSFQKAFKSDPLQSSRMIVTLLMSLKSLDEMAMLDCPLLKDHSCLEAELDISSVLQRLIVPTPEERARVEELETYFQKRTQGAVKYNSTLLNEANPTSSSPCVRLSASNPDAQALILKLKRQIQIDYAVKVQEIAHMRKKYAELELEHRNASCTCDFTDYPYKKRRYNLHPDSSCLKNVLYKQIQALSLYQYVYPMPMDNVNYQNAFAYESVMPVSVACLRDVMLLTLIHLCPEVHWERVKKQLGSSNYEFSDVRIEGTSSKKSEMVSLQTKRINSIRKLIKDTHEDGQFFVKSEELNYKWKQSNSGQHTQISHFDLPKGSPYKKLEPFCANWTADANKVLAIDDTLNLTRLELVEFGLLRSGHRIQYRNIYRTLAGENLTLDKDVFCLIAQALWQIGPVNSERGRESHHELGNNVFVSEFLDLVEGLLSNTKDNWTATFTLITIIVIVKQIAEYNQSLKLRALEFLRKCRLVAHQWLKDIHAFIETNTKEQEAIKAHLLNTALSGALTYTGSSQTELALMQNSDDAFYWLCFREIIFNERRTNNSESDVHTHLWQSIKTHSYSINPLLTKIIDQDHDVLDKFTRTHPGLESIGKSMWTNEGQVYKASTDEFSLFLDTGRGEFLINGNPSSRLPQEILQNEDFRRVFNQANFQVSCKATVQGTIYSSKETDYSSVFQFLKEKSIPYYNYYGSRSSTTVIVSEKRSNTTYELIPVNRMIREMPEALVGNYSHWWDKRLNKIEFRPKCHTDKDFTKPKFILHLNSKILVDTATDACLINNKQADELMGILSRFELPKYILIWLEDGEIIGKLPRHNLSFKYGMDGILCQESGMILNQEHNLGTLFGLRRFLLLEDNLSLDAVKMRKLLVPHGHIKTAEGSVDVDINQLRNPPSFVFTIDPILKVLNAGPYTHAWLYLAALHAVTTSPIPDTFTGQTGLERAVQILLSGRCRSTSPFEEESLTTLEFLCGLFPKRKFKEEKVYQHHKKGYESVKIQRVEYTTSGVSIYAAYEGYYFILKRMLEESKTLGFLFGNKPSVQKVDDLLSSVDETVMARAYWMRIGFYNEAAWVPLDIMPVLYRSPSPLAIWKANAHFPMGIRVHPLHAMAGLCSTWKCTVSFVQSVKRLIYSTSSSLEGLKPKAVDDLVGLYNGIRSYWIQLYNHALTSSREEWTLIMCDIAYRSTINLEDLLVLHTIAVNKDKFRSPPKVLKYQEIDEVGFQTQKVRAILERREKSFSDHNYQIRWRQSNPEGAEKYDETTWKKARSAYIVESIKNVQDNWTPYNESLRSGKGSPERKRILDRCIQDISQSDFLADSYQNMGAELHTLFSSWHNNYLLQVFVDQVEVALASCPVDNSTNQILNWQVPGAYQFSKMIGHICTLQTMETGNKWPKVSTPKAVPVGMSTPTTAGKLYQKLKKVISEKYDSLRHSFINQDKYTYLAGLTQRLVPSRLFPTILHDVPQEQKTFLLRLAQTTTKFQRICRILRYSTDENKSYLKDLELLNKPHTGWKPAEFPEWILLELDMNITIREIQVKIAKHMMDDSSGSMVTQLNMGEGKTSVILPMVVSTLAQKKQECVRVTVLKSLYQTNFEQLKNSIGGLLGQLLHSLPCDRDLGLTPADVTTVSNLCKNVVQQKGVILTVPEHRLSWELRGYESYDRDQQLCQNLVNLSSWIENNCRDILDESDEILSPRYQKVYAMGSSDELKISDIRWKVGQQILKKVPSLLHSLTGDYQDCIEMEESEQQTNFPKCRLLNYTEKSQECYDKFAQMLTEDFIKSEFGIEESELTNLVSEYLTNASFPEEKYDLLESQESIKLTLPRIHAMAEYLSHPGILQSALNKRWRVNYGVGRNTSSKMAVPFKAKDVAYEKTEFGHPAMAIILTQLSYYYSGLTEYELDKCLEVLEKRENPVVEFDEWTASTDLGFGFKALNKNFLPQKVRLFKALKNNTTVIDFYLTHCIFPKELKRYPGKITTTAWDLCHSKKNNVAGFSGTNDAQLLLPMTIKQKDLEELQETNDKVQKSVEKSKDYFALTTWIPRGTEILEMLSKKGIKILIDAGALMIDMDNSQVADKWLEVDQSLDGVVFFYENKRVVRIRKGVGFDCDFAASPLSETLGGRCAVYMDDEHTRGTDFRFPMRSVGCVTLGGRLPRDKLVQACMRMRQLQSGDHNIAFIATKDVDNQIKSLVGEVNPITAADVMTWVIRNSKEWEKEGLVFYSNNALNFVKKRAAFVNFLHSHNFDRFGREVMDIEKDEKDFPTEEVFSSVISTCFDTALATRAESSIAGEEITNLFRSTKMHVVNLIDTKLPGKCCFSSSLEEQQEREIEQEKEVQVQLAKPVQHEPYLHTLHQDVVDFVTKNSLSTQGGIVELEIPGIYASLDFLQVVKSGSILRPVNWVVSGESSKGTTCVLLSSYEVNEVIKLYWRGCMKTTLHMFSPRVRQGQNILMNVTPLQLGVEKEIGGELLGKLHVYSGSLYLEGEEFEWYRSVLEQLQGRFDIVKIIERRLLYFPENCHVRQLLKG